jgi:hypothetical protein
MPKAGGFEQDQLIQSIYGISSRGTRAGFTSNMLDIQSGRQGMKDA